jgi:hypothetical protein
VLKQRNKQTISAADVGRRVCVNNEKYGTLCFVGPVLGKQGVYAGVALDAQDGIHDGEFDGIRYFSTLYNHGVFVPVDRVRLHRLIRNNTFSADDDTSSTVSLVRMSSSTTVNLDAGDDEFSLLDDTTTIDDLLVEEPDTPATPCSLVDGKARKLGTRNVRSDVRRPSVTSTAPSQPSVLDLDNSVDTNELVASVTPTSDAAKILSVQQENTDDGAQVNADVQAIPAAHVVEDPHEQVLSTMTTLGSVYRPQ